MGGLHMALLTGASFGESPGACSQVPTPGALRSTYWKILGVEVLSRFGTLFPSVKALTEVAPGSLDHERLSSEVAKASRRGVVPVVLTEGAGVEETSPSTSCPLDTGSQRAPDSSVVLDRPLGAPSSTCRKASVGEGLSSEADAQAYSKERERDRRNARKAAGL